MHEMANIYSTGDTLRAVGLALAMFAGGVGALTGSNRLTAPTAATPVAGVSDGCIDETLGVDADPWERSELFFGTAKPDGSAVSEAEWNWFLATEVTPRFPDGLTVLGGNGQWQGEDGEVVRERSKLLILLYPRENAETSGEQIEAIRAAYESAFDQESVLRADDGEPSPVRVSF